MNAHPSSSPARRAHDHERKKKKDETLVPFISDLFIACISLQMGGIRGCVDRMNLLVQQLGGPTARRWTPASHTEHAQMSPVQLQLAQPTKNCQRPARKKHKYNTQDTSSFWHGPLLERTSPEATNKPPVTSVFSCLICPESPFPSSFPHPFYISIDAHHKEHSLKAKLANRLPVHVEEGKLHHPKNAKTPPDHDFRTNGNQNSKSRLYKVRN